MSSLGNNELIGIRRNGNRIRTGSGIHREHLCFVACAGERYLCFLRGIGGNRTADGEGLFGAGIVDITEKLCCVKVASAEVNRAFYAVCLQQNAVKSSRAVCSSRYLVDVLNGAGGDYGSRAFGGNAFHNHESVIFARRSGVAYIKRTVFVRRVIHRCCARCKGENRHGKENRQEKCEFLHVLHPFFLCELFLR